MDVRLVNMYLCTQDQARRMGYLEGRSMGRRSDEGRALGQWVKARRTAIGLTQEQLAAAMSYDFDVPTSWVSALEAGRRTYLPDFKYIEALASALRVLPTDVQRGAGVLPVDVSAQPEIAPGSATIHALVDMIDWTSQPHRREVAESLLRTFLEQDQRASRPKPAGAGASHERQ
jgi:transcriptional regulator with XRE-family HTH domain